MTLPTLKLLVLKTPLAARLRAFYQAHGVELAEEKHGSGPAHYAGRVGETVLEVYPLRQGDGPADTTTRLAFVVESLAEVIQALREVGTEVPTEPQQTVWGVRIISRDPDGRAVELYQR
jgi:hypothetical protein